MQELKVPTSRTFIFLSFIFFPEEEEVVNHNFDFLCIIT